MRFIDADNFDERVRIAVGMCEYEVTEDFKEGIQATLTLLKTEPTTDAIPVTELKAHIYKMNHRDIRSALVMDGYKQALEEMLGWIVGYGEDKSGK